MLAIRVRGALIISLLPLLSGCITVNVNFPEAAVQQASDSYVEQLYRMREEAEKQKAGSSEADKGAQLSPWQSPWSLLIPQAWAKEFRMQSELITEIQRREASRLDQVERFKREGLIGENNQALLELRGSPKTLQKRRIESLIKAENQDRQRLYEEVLRINGMDRGQKSTVVNKFANSFQNKSPKGTWIQNSQGQWSKK